MKENIKEKVYIDSTIPSFYFDERKSIKLLSQITKLWWDEESKNYELWTSEAVLHEVNDGNYPNKEQIKNIIKEIPILKSCIEIEKTTIFYIENYVMPKSDIGDAAHLAYASYYNFEYLLTWNCNHLANANKRKHICVINKRLGFNTPEIITPLELFKEK